tara:strand:- start:37716 stop:37889 length:174 start_codon:yes stop_codon:yes gene_type:complete
MFFQTPSKLNFGTHRVLIIFVMFFKENVNSLKTYQHFRFFSSLPANNPLNLSANSKQ